jgi:hypothetical protein
MLEYFYGYKGGQSQEKKYWFMYIPDGYIVTNNVIKRCLEIEITLNNKKSTKPDYLVPKMDIAPAEKLMLTKCHHIALWQPDTAKVEMALKPYNSNVDSNSRLFLQKLRDPGAKRNYLFKPMQL